MKIMKKKKGFTLIELMIVLAIIAILAVVLIPKAGIFKNQAKDAGVTTNVNTVKAYLETKTSDASGIESYLSASTNPTLESVLENAFNLDGSYIPTGSSTSEQLVNPFNAAAPSIAVNQNTANMTTGTYTPTTTGYSEGEVIIDAYTDGYIVYGIDNSGNATQYFIVK